MYKYRNRRFKVEKDEKEQPKDTTSQTNQEQIKTEMTQPKQDNYGLPPTNIISFQKDEAKEDKVIENTDNLERINNDSNYDDKKAMSNDIYKAKSGKIEDNKEVSEFENTNKKLRNTMTGLNNNKMKYESGLIDIILKVEKDNVNHYLKGDLAEMYNDINKDNLDFKNNIFLPNVDNFEKKTGILDKKPIIPYNCNEDISFKLNKYPKTNEIIEKFTEKTKTFNIYN